MSSRTSSPGRMGSLTSTSDESRTTIVGRSLVVWVARVAFLSAALCCAACGQACTSMSRLGGQT